MRWLTILVQTLSVYSPRSISYLAQIATDASNDDAAHRVRFVCGPGGVWLAELTTVSFDAHGGLLLEDELALKRLYELCFEQANNWCDDDDDDDDETVERDDRYAEANENARKTRPVVESPSTPIRVWLNWFRCDGASRARQRCQCFVRFDANNANVVVLILPNRAADTQQQRTATMRPFVVFMLTELLARGAHFSLTCATGAIVQRNSGELTDRDDGASYASLIEFVRQANAYATWLKLHTGALVSVTRSPSGLLRYAWVNARERQQYERNTGGVAWQSLPSGSVIPLYSLRALPDDEDREYHLLALCGFHTLLRYASGSLVVDNERRLRQLTRPRGHNELVRELNGATDCYSSYNDSSDDEGTTETRLDHGADGGDLVVKYDEIAQPAHRDYLVVNARGELVQAKFLCASGSSSSSGGGNRPLDELFDLDVTGGVL